jgi:HK97 family phage major capsid protein
MITKSFEDTIIDGVNELRGQQADLIRNLDQLDKSVKSAFEEMTRLKNQQADHATLLASVRKTLGALERERRNVCRSREDAVIQNILGNEERRTFWNALLRRTLDPRMKLPEHMERALTTESGLGGATVPNTVAEEIYSTLSTFGVWAGFDVMRVPANTVAVPVATSRPTPYWIGAGAGAAQGTAITANDPAGSSVSVGVQTLGALVHVNRELVQDSAVDIAGSANWRRAWRTGWIGRA